MSLSSTEPPGLKDRYTSALIFGLVFGTALFLLLPISQMLSQGLLKSDKNVEISVIEPPELFEQPPPPEEEIVEEEIEELEKDQEPPTLEQLEISMNADVSGMASGDFSMPSYSLADEIEEMIYEMKDLTVAPRAIIQSEPNYPPELKRNGIEGEVRMEFVIRKDGTTDDIRVLRSSNPGFEEPTIKAVRRWKFEAGERGGEKVSVRVRINIPFKVS